MRSESGEQQSRSPAARTSQNHHHHQNSHLAPPPPQTEALPCPRCDSSNTKFCYYNNYNLSQPRHFCKSCRRYWTHGGTLRDVPVGGGSRKTTRRSRSSSASAAATSSSSSSSASKPGSVVPHLPPVTKPEPVHAGSTSDDNPNPRGNECASSNGIGFTSLLNSQAPGGFLALGGQGYGYGLDELSGFGYGAKPAWPFHEVAEFGGGAGHNTWQIATGSEGGLVDGSPVDCFVWPDLSISMPGGNGLTLK